LNHAGAAGGLSFAKFFVSRYNNPHEKVHDVRKNFTDGRASHLAPRPLQSHELDPKVPEFAVRRRQRQADARLHRLHPDAQQSAEKESGEGGSFCLNDFKKTGDIAGLFK
jgi:hypothetical protein